MAEKKCPSCSSQSFYVKDPQDEYEFYEFDVKCGEPVLSPKTPETNWPNIGEDTETYCSSCAWHGKFKTLKTTDWAAPSLQRISRDYAVTLATAVKKRFW